MSGTLPQYTFAEGNTAPAETEIVFGDADEDEKVGINYAVKIMSYVNTVSKYEFSDSAKEATDVYNTGDGINNMEALEIMKYLAGITAKKIFLKKVREIVFSYD